MSTVKFLSPSVLAYAVIALLGCRSQSPRPRTIERPTASELFNLRTKCADLAEKINSQYDYASLAIVYGIPALSQDHFSHYDSTANRCYVELRVTALGSLTLLSAGNAKAKRIRQAILDIYDVDYIERHLYDGQTGEELAYVQKGLKNHSAVGLLQNMQVGWAAAYSRIDEVMADDRK
jgi:hypothetical protein